VDEPVRKPKGASTQQVGAGEGGSLALPGAGPLVELAAEAVVLGVQVTQASLKSRAFGTRDGLHTCLIDTLANDIIGACQFLEKHGGTATAP